MMDIYLSLNYIAVLLLTTLLAGGVLSKQSVFEELKESEDLGQLIATVQAPSLISCAQKCKRNKHCYSLLFFKDTEECYLLTGTKDGKNNYIVADEEVRHVLIHFTPYF